MKTSQHLSTRAVSSSEHGETISGPREILVAIDFSPASIKALHHARELAAKEQAHLTLLNVVSEPPTFRNLDTARQEHRERQEHALQLQQLARRELEPGITFDTLVRTGDPSTEIKRVAAQQHASMIVIGRHPHQGFYRWFHPNTANRLIKHAPCPVMVLNEEPEAASAI